MLFYLIIRTEYIGIGEGAVKKLYGVFESQSLAEKAMSQLKERFGYEVVPVEGNYIFSEPVVE